MTILELNSLAMRSFHQEVSLYGSIYNRRCYEQREVMTTTLGPEEAEILAATLRVTIEWASEGMDRLETAENPEQVSKILLSRRTLTPDTVWGLAEIGVRREFLTKRAATCAG